MFVAGMLTIFLPCILPLLPIVLGVSIAGRSKWRPLFTVLGMVISFVAFTFLLLVVLSRFIELADIIRIATYQLLLLFGVCFVTESRPVRWTVAALGGLFFLLKGSTAVVLASLLGVVSVEAGGQLASGIQQFGTKVQSASRGILGVDSPINALIMGLTLGLVWAPCAGPALGFALTVVREQPGPLALAYLLAYGLGTAVPLLFVGYGGQAAVHSVRAIAKYSGRIKQIAGALLMLTALTLQLNGFTSLQIWLLERTPFGDLGTRLEESLFGSAFDDARAPAQPSSSSASQPSSSADAMQLPALPVIVRAPSEYPGLGPWHNGQPLTKADLQGKVVLVDFWTYSCINCIRTLPYIQGYWEKYKDTGKFVLLGVHCHGANGAGDGPVVNNGKYPPPGAYNGPLKDLPEGKIFHSLTYGKNVAMGSHASQLNKEERWLVTHYVQYLQNGGKMTREASADTTATAATN
jgi:cytochrome c biogenesis protein CcdA/thiol-disulfide isomerase/thioredoxin